MKEKRFVEIHVSQHLENQMIKPDKVKKNGQQFNQPVMASHIFYKLILGGCLEKSLDIFFLLFFPSVSSWLNSPLL